MCATESIGSEILTSRITIVYRPRVHHRNEAMFPDPSSDFGTVDKMLF